MSYRAPIAEMEFCAAQIVGQDRLAQTSRFAEATSETRAAILEEAAKLCEGALVPINRIGDIQPARLENGVVRCPPGFREAYQQIAEGGWVGITGDPEYGGMGLPQCFATFVNEMMASSCLALSLNPLMSQGQIEALEHHASDEIKALYLPKLTSGTWNGTMNLTEPHAGSDVGTLSTKAEPNGDGSYAISGQKIYISWGDHDVCENICHLVLARLPDGAPGTKGISLFLVPKFIPDENGNPGVANSLRPVSLEHKLGLHGSPTAVMEYDRASGWIVGAPHGGMAAMFTMMNNARLGVGVEGLGIAEAATQKAVAFALERKQGRTPDGSGTIIGHADVRRMLMTMKALTQVVRAICYDCAFSLDMGRAAETADEREFHARRGAFLTPIAKAFGTDTGCEVAQLGIQVHGGMGFIEETGAAQYARDVRVTAIYEGTNGIHAMDLVGRKLSVDGGEMARSMEGEIDATTAELAAAGPDFAALAQATSDAAGDARTATDWMLEAPEQNDRAAGGSPYLRLMALALGVRYLSQGALAARGGPDEAARLAMAVFFATQIAPQTKALAAAATQGAAQLYALDAEMLGA
ncbi:MAG: acyl-CoA dehydrogenase [Paracoccaceae bacterium]|nr:acyl-CoA dehydrogenase [Paracoccaceae bacterium]